MATYKLPAEHSFSRDGVDGEVTYIIHFKYRRGYAGTRYVPPEPAGFDLVKVTRENGVELEPEYDVSEWAQEWLDDHYDECYHEMEK